MRYQVIDNFLTPEECQQMIEMAKPRLQDSTGWDVEKGQNTKTDYRNSSQMWFGRNENELIERIEKRIADVTKVPVENGEQLQLVRYREGEHYKVHWDYFDPAWPQNDAVLARGGQRIITFMVFLTDVEHGGETHFPRVPNEDKTDSLKIKPKQGRAIMWWNVDEQGRLDKDTYHEGCDPTKPGEEKWIFTKWIRERTFI